MVGKQGRLTNAEVEEMTHRFTLPKGFAYGGPCVGAALAVVLLLVTTPTRADPFEMELHAADVYGAEEVESGDYDEAIRRLQLRLGGERQSRSHRTPVLIDLCVAHTMMGNFDKASKRCDEAVETGWSSGLARNNRAVLWISMGRYQDAIGEFENALGERDSKTLARRNLQRAFTRVAALQEQQGTTRVVSVSAQQTGTQR
ncbi:MAG: tetratricopeptide repeat protein [Gammaproteobacteria bacterium]